MESPSPGIGEGEGARVSSIYVAIGKTAKSKKIVAQREVTFEQFASMLRQAPVHVGKLNVDEYLTLKAGSKDDKDRAFNDKDAAWFSLARYTKPLRAASNVDAVSAFVGDFDSGQLTEEEISSKVAGYKHITLTTYSHTPEHPKYRLIVPYSRPVTPAEHAALFESFMSLFGEQVDSSTRDACRLWYFPSAAADTTQHQAITIHDGMVFEPPSEMAEAAEEDPLPQKEALDASANADLADSRERDKPTAEQIRRMLSYIKIPDEAGKRRGPWFTVLCGVHAWAEGSDEGFALIDEWSSSQPAYVGSEDVRKTWGSCGRRDGITIATVIKLAVEGGYVDEEDEPLDADVAEVLEQVAIETDGGARAFLEQVNKKKDSGVKVLDAARATLEEHLVYVFNQEEYFSLKHRRLLTRDAIRQVYRSQMPKVDGVRKDPCKLLEESRTKEVVASVGYHPGEGPIYTDRGLRFANQHVPYVVEPLIPTAREIELFKQLVGHIFPAKSDGVMRNYILQFLAYAVQNPGLKITSAPLLYSQETGTGKTTMMFELPVRLFGPHNCTTVSNEEVDSSFSDYLCGKHLIHLDEIFMGGMRRAAAAANRFKPIITNDAVRVHPKGFAGYDMVNRLLVTACSNYSNALHLTEFDRRWAVHEVKSGKMDKGFAVEFYRMMNSARGPGVLKHIFQQIPTTGFNPNADAPMTSAKKAMIESSYSDIEGLIKEAMGDGAPPFDKDIFTMESVATWLEAQVGKKMSSKSAGRFVLSVAPEIKRAKQIRWGKSRIRVWCHRNSQQWQLAAPPDLAKELGMQDGLAEEAA